MARTVVYVAVQQFCQTDGRPLRILREGGFEVRQNALGRRLRKEDLLELLSDAEAVLAGVEPYDAQLLSRLPRLRCISRCGVGTDSIDLEAARHHGITIYTTADEVAEPVAQLTVGFILALARNMPQHLRELDNGLWKKRLGVLLSEWTIGLVGFGRIGRKVEQCLRVFKPRVLAADPRLSQDDVPDSVELRSLSSLLADADVVSVHASRRPGEGAILGRHELALMKQGSYVVNTARGFLVDESALLEALRSGHLAGAALDVFQVEPDAGPLAHLPNVLCTPHVATLTRASRAAMELRCAQQVVDHFASAQCTDAHALGKSVTMLLKP
jgi:D-3-phosphoglycerate dehydrogenase